VLLYYNPKNLRLRGAEETSKVKRLRYEEERVVFEIEGPLGTRNFEATAEQGYGEIYIRTYIQDEELRKGEQRVATRKSIHKQEASSKRQASDGHSANPKTVSNTDTRIGTKNQMDPK
jgi:hypothetical protein